MSKRIYFDKPAPVDNLGRNGYSRACGVNVYCDDNMLFIESINSKGNIGNARIVVPKEYVVALITALHGEFCR